MAATPTILLFLVAALTHAVTGKAPRDTLQHTRSDDVTLSSLENLVHSQAAVIQNLQAKVTADEQKFAALQSTVQSQTHDIATLKSRLNAVSKPVAFSVRFADDDATHGISLGQHSTLRFNHVTTNYGNGYDPKTGIFRAPVSGIYSFFLNAMGVNSHHDLRLALVKENNAVDAVMTESSQQNDQASSQVTCHMTAGQRVWVRQSLGDAVRGSWYTVFTGFLVQAD